MLNKGENPQRRFYSRHQAVAVKITGAIFFVTLGSGLFASESLEIKILVVLTLLGMAIVGMRIIRSGVETFVPGVKVRNVFSTFDLLWHEIDRFEVGQAGLLPMVCLIHLKEGKRRHAFGIQERTNFPDGSAEQIAEELNAELNRRLASAAARN